jgi:MFS family permease
MYITAASILDLIFQFIIFAVIVNSFGLVLRDKLKEHGRRASIMTLLLLGSIGILMIPRFLRIAGQIWETIFIRKDFSSSFLNMHLLHAFFGAITVIATVYLVADWARLGFDEEAHRGGGKMWAATVGWILALIFGIGVFIVDLYVLY